MTDYLATPIGELSIWSDDIFVRVGLGDGSPGQTQGFGGWEEIERQRRKSLTTWKGRQPWRIPVAVLFDTLTDPGNGFLIERDIRNLEKLAGGGINGEPPIVRFDSGGLIPHDYTDAGHVKWVIDGIEFGDAIRNHNGNRIRQAVSITFLEYVADETLKEFAAKHRAQPGQKKCKPAHKRYVTKQGDTLIKIAKVQYHDANCWKSIVKANPKHKLRDPRRPLKAGIHLRLA
jgi:hypothetical protein